MLIKKVLLVLLATAIIGSLFCGCEEKYSIEEPFDFSSIATKAPQEDTNDVIEDVGNNEQEAVQPEEIGNPFLEQAEQYVVPEDVVVKMKTEVLLETYMSYPMIGIICFEENPVEAYDIWVKETDNCIKELAGREDTIGKIIELYTSLVAAETKTHISEDKDYETEKKIDWLEFLLLNESIKIHATAEQKKEIVKLATTRDDNNFQNGYAIADLYPDLAAAYK
ncbi:MAG: hypothetical protein E7388_01710 [Ruminococcaceae bacterium]|nr:hypothetical protein [Oscillospiraceae bacterium]